MTPELPAPADESVPEPRRGKPPGPLLVLLAYVGFVSLGLPDAALGVAWPSLRDEFGLAQNRLGLVLIGGACGHVASGFFAGRLLSRFGVGLLLAGSTGLVAAAAFGYAASPFWLAFLAVAALHGLGSGAIDAGLNTFAAHRLSARHMNWLHACYCLGAMIGPLVMTAVLASGQPWRAGYAAIGFSLLVLTVLFAMTRRRWNDGAADHHSTPAAGTFETLLHPAVLLQMLVFFLYTGLEVVVGQWSFTVFTESRGVSEKAAGVWVGIYWGCIGVGRVLFGFVVERFGIDPLLRGALAGAVAGTILFAGPWTTPAFVGLALIGLALAPVYPCLMTRTPQRLGPALAVHAVGFQVSAAMLGAAILPGAVGLAVGRFDLEVAPKAAAASAAALWLLHEVLLLCDRRSPRREMSRSFP